MSVSAKVHLVLHSLEEFLGGFHARILVNTESIYFKNLAIEYLFRAAYVADSRKQLVEVAGIFADFPKKSLEYYGYAGEFANFVVFTTKI